MDQDALCKVVCDGRVCEEAKTVVEPYPDCISIHVMQPLALSRTDCLERKLKRKSSAWMLGVSEDHVGLLAVLAAVNSVRVHS